MIQQDQLLLAWLFSAISTSVLPQIASHKTSHDLWTALGAIFNTRSKSRILQLKNQLQNFRKEGLGADDYVARLTTMAEELREAGTSIDDGELTLIALNVLDASYDPFVTAQTVRMDDVSFASFLGLLRSHEIRLNRSTDFKGIAIANAIQSVDTTVTCQICLKHGHSAIQCFKCHNEQCFSTQHTRNKNRYKGSKPYNAQANAVWYPDTGVSDHVTGDTRNIQNPDTQPATQAVVVANGRLQSEAQGMAWLI